MNKTYKTVWNETTGTWMAVPEIATSRSKSDKSKAVKMLTAASASVAAALVTSNAYAAPGIYINDGVDHGCVATTDDYSNSGIHSLYSNAMTRILSRFVDGVPSPAQIAAGDTTTYSSTPMQYQNFGIGTVPDYYPCLSVNNHTTFNSPVSSVSGATDRNTQTNRTLFYNDTGDYNVSDKNNGAKSLTLGGRLDVNSGIIGVGNQGENGVGATNSIRIGKGTTLDSTNDHTDSIAIGKDVTASADQTVAIGSKGSASGENAIALGNNAQASGKNSISIGTDNQVSKEGSVTIGNNNIVGTEKTFVLGDNVKNTFANSVFLGSESASGGIHSGSYTYQGLNDSTVAGKSPTGVVSVGDAGKERQIQNVAAGVVSAASTDAINGSQLYTIATGLSNNMPVVYTKADGTKVTKQPDGSFIDASGNPVVTGDVITSINSSADSTTTPTTLANVAGSLEPTYNVGDATVTNGKPDATHPSNAWTVYQAAPTNAAGIYNNAASVGDVLNAGWNLQGNGTGKDFVKAYDTVNFADGQGTTAVVTTSADGKTSTIKFNTPLTYMDNTGAATTTPSNAVSFVGANSSKPVAVQNVASGLVDNSTGGTVTLDNATGATLNNAVNVGDLKNAIDSVNTSVANSGFTLTANGQNGSKVTPNATVNMKNTDGNIKISKTATGNDVTYDLNPNLDLGSTGSLKTGDTTVNNNGVTINNGAAGSPVSLTKNGLNNGNNKITNVAAGTADTDAVNLKQLKDTIGQSAAAAKTEVQGSGLATVTPTTGANGQSIYTVDVAKAAAPTFNNGSVSVASTDSGKVMTAGDVVNAINNAGFTLTAAGANGSLVKPGATVDMRNTDGNILISKNSGDNSVVYNLNRTITVDTVKTGNTTVNNDGITINNGAAGNPVKLTNNGLDNGGNKITNVAAGDISATSTDAVNGSQLYQIAQHVTNNVTTSSPVQYSNSSNPTVANGGTKSNDVTLVGLNSDPVTLHNVAPGRAGTDAVNVNQLGQVAGNLNNRINKVADEADAGTAAAMAAAGLPQAYLPGKSMVAVSGSTYRGKQGYAVGMSAITDGGNWIIKGIATGNSEGHFGATIGAGYQW